MFNCKIKESLSFTQSQVFKLDEPCLIAYACMLSRVPCLFIGNPGTAKSHTFKAIANQFGERDNDWFYQSITAKTSPEKLFGGLIAEQALNGVEEYNLAVGASTKIGNIFDELYKSQHPAMMNALLAYTDEQPTIFSGGKNITPSYQWLFATTNFDDLPEDLKFNPLWDRMHGRVIVKNLSKDESKMALKATLKANSTSTKKIELKVTVDDLEASRKEALKTPVSNQLIDFFYECLLPILEKYCYISQRKIHSLFIGKNKDCPSIVQSLAYLISDPSIEVLKYLPYFCWQDVNSLDDMLKQFANICILPIINTYRKIARDLVDFVNNCEKNHFTDYAIANQELVFLTETIAMAVKGFEEKDKQLVPETLRESLPKLINQAKAAKEKIIKDIDSDVAF